MTLSDHQFEFLKDVCKLIEFAIDQGAKVTGGELERKPEMQKIYLEKGLTKTANSQHMKKLAIDLNFFIDGKLTYNKAQLQEIGDYWEGLSGYNRWGGNFKTFIDTPHFERFV